MMYDPCTDGRPEYFDIDGDHPFADGLKFLGAGRFPESKYFHDSSQDFRGGGGSGNHGTLTNMAVPATATSGWAWDSFLGRWTTGYMGTTDKVAYTLPNLSVFSITSWAKIDTDTGWKAATILAGVDTNCVVWPRAASGLQVNTSDYSSVGTGVAVPINVWLPYAFTASGTSAVLYQAGIAYPKTLAAAFNLALSVGSGLLLTSASHLSDICVWNRALSAAEIAALADPSNVMLSGLLLPPRRRIFAAAAAATGNRRRRVLCTGA
jgi:hypothetical protein